MTTIRLACGAVPEERHPHQTSGEREQQLEITVPARVAEGQVEVIAVAHGRDAMRRGIGSADAARPVHLHVEAAGARARAAREPEAPRVAHAIEDLGVAQGDLARLARVDREDASADQAVACQLDQRWVALAPDDRLVQRARLRRVHHFALELAIPLPEREVAENRFARHGIEVRPLVHRSPAVAEPLLHRHARDASRHGDLHGASELLDPARGKGTDRLDPALPGEHRGEAQEQCASGCGPSELRDHDTHPCERCHERRRRRGIVHRVAETPWGVSS